MNFKHFFVIIAVALIVAGVGLWFNYYLIIRGEVKVPSVQAPDKAIELTK